MTVEIVTDASILIYDQFSIFILDILHRTDFTN